MIHFCLILKTNHSWVGFLRKRLYLQDFNFHSYCLLDCFKIGISILMVDVCFRDKDAPKIIHAIEIFEEIR